MTMKITVRPQDPYYIVRVEGKIVRENQAELRSKLEEVIGKGGVKGIALDFEAIDYLDSAGLGCCASIHKLLFDRKCGPLVMFGASPNIERMWKLIRLDLVIPLFQKEQDALAQLAAKK
ncbi:MAG: STAS domain-containing protein [Planctomycetes bacterium]|nr:STAS domain-containing protein [Planctomycetota bacterium]